MTAQKSRRPVQAVLTMLVLAWFLLMLNLGTNGFFYRHEPILGLSAVQQAIVFPIVLFIVAYLTIPALKHHVGNASLTFLVAIQVARILALSHLVSWGYGLMAGGFAIPVALGNFIVFILALASIDAVASRSGHWKGRVLWLTIVGILEFLMTIALAILGYFTYPLTIDPTMAPGGYVSFASAPLSLFPTLAIPLLLIVHVSTLIALRHQATQQAPG